MAEVETLVITAEPSPVENLLAMIQSASVLAAKGIPSQVVLNKTDVANLATLGFRFHTGINRVPGDLSQLIPSVSSGRGERNALPVK